MKEVNIWEAKEFVDKHKYFLNKKNRTPFFVISVILGILALLFIQLSYEISTQNLTISTKGKILKNVTFFSILISWLTWIYFHYINYKRKIKNYNNQEKIVTWYERYKKYRDGMFKRKQELTITVKNIHICTDRYRNRIVYRVQGESNAGVLREYYIFDEENGKFLMNHMEIEIQARDEIVFDVKYNNKKN